MIGLDTNVLVRYITQDHPEQSKLATDYIEKKCTANSPGYVNHIVICELIWVLNRAYRFEKNIVSEVIGKILLSSELVVEDSDTVWQALEAYKSESADFADYLISIKNHSAGCVTTSTFDKAAAGFPLFKYLK
jgi:predicted nucleic-acid-binding protein